MSAAPSLPPNYEPPDENLNESGEPPRRRLWPRILAWIGIGLLTLVVLVVAGIAFELHSSRVHQYVLATAQQKATAALGANVNIREFALTFSGISPTLDLYGVTVAGAAPYGNTQLLQAERARAGVRIVSVLGRKWYLSDLEVHHPVVHVFVDKQGGNNLPKPQSDNNTNSNTDIFDLGVRHAVLDQGEIYYNDNKSVLSADLHDLNFQSSFATDQRRYSGTLGYRDGHLISGTLNPIPHDLDAQFDATPTQFNLHNARLQSGRSQFVLNAAVTDYSHPKVNATYDAVVDATEFRRILKNQTLPAGLIQLAGTLQYASAPNVPALQSAVLQGKLASNSLQVRTPSFNGVVRDIAAQYSLVNGNLDVPTLRANVLGGALAGSASIRDVSGNSRSKLRASLKDAQVAQVKPLLKSPSLRNVSLGGTVSADVDATWGKTLDDLSATSNAIINTTVGSSANGATTNTIPLNGVIHATYAARSRQITLANSSIRTPQTSVDLSGTVSTRSALRVQVRSNELHELETIADIFRTPTPGKPAAPLGLSGTATFNGAVSGTTNAPHLTGQLVANNLRVRDTAWRTLRTGVEASPSSVSLQNGELAPATRGNINFSGSAGLHNWSFTNTSPVQISLNASQLNVADIAKAAGLQSPAKGTLNAHLQAHGSQLSPTGEGEITLTKATLAGEALQSADVKFNGTGDAVRANAVLRLPSGAADAVLTYFPKQQRYEAQVHANGIHLDQLQTIKARNMQIAGVVNLNANGAGTLNDPQLTASLTIPSLRIQDQTIGNVSFQVSAANHVANFALDSSVMNTPIRGRGTLNLTGDYLVNATLDTPRIALQPFIATYMPEQSEDISGETELHATVRGPLKNKTALEAHATIPVLSLNYQKLVQIAAPTPIRIDYTNGVLNVQRSSLRGTGTDLQFQATVPIADANAPASLLTLGTIDLRLARLFIPDVDSAGQVRFNINSYGQRSDPNVQGQVEIVNASFATPDTPVGLSNGNGVLTLTKDRLLVSKFQGIVGGGNVTASGGILYRPSMQFNLALSGEGIRMLLPSGIRAGVSTNLALSGTLDSSTLRGQVDIDQLSFTPDFDIAAALGQLGGTISPPPSQGFMDNLQLDVGVRSTNGINLVSRELSLQGTANLNTRGTANDPVITGRVNVNNGDLIFRGNRYLVQNGTIDFTNPTRTEPRINVSISTTIQQYNIAMRLEGPVDRLRTSYNSDPALPPSDIINLLAFGKTTEAEAANPNPPGTLGAQSVLASAVSGEVTNRLQKIAGISQLSVDPVLGNNQQNPGATVTIQQRVTGKIFVTFSTDVTGTQRDVVQLQYQKSPRVSFSGTRDQNGGFGFDVRIRKNW